MKNTSILTLAVVILTGIALTTSAGQAPHRTIGFIDFEKILKQSHAGQAATREFEDNLKKFQSQLDEKQNVLKAAFQEYQKNIPKMDRDVALKREEELRGEMAALQKMYADLESSLAAKRVKLIKQIIEKASPEIQKTAKKRGLVMVLDRSAVVWSAAGTDITDDLMQTLQ